MSTKESERPTQLTEAFRDICCHHQKGGFCAQKLWLGSSGMFKSCSLLTNGIHIFFCESQVRMIGVFHKSSFILNFVQATTNQIVSARLCRFSLTRCFPLCLPTPSYPLGQVSDAQLWQGGQTGKAPLGSRPRSGGDSRVSPFPPGVSKGEYKLTSERDCSGHKDSRGVRLLKKEGQRHMVSGSIDGCSEWTGGLDFSGLSCLPRGCWMDTDIFRAWSKKTKGGSGYELWMKGATC